MSSNSDSNSQLETTPKDGRAETDLALETSASFDEKKTASNGPSNSKEQSSTKAPAQTDEDVSTSVETKPAIRGDEEP